MLGWQEIDAALAEPAAKRLDLEVAQLDPLPDSSDVGLGERACLGIQDLDVDRRTRNDAARSRSGSASL